jgi:hypothetical protein
MVFVFDLKYGEIYYIRKNVPAVYIGNNLNGKGRILYRDKMGSPVILGFNLENAKLENKVLVHFGGCSTFVLNNKEKSYALEILNKKSL